jgi:hypothetical protein
VSGYDPDWPWPALPEDGEAAAEAAGMHLPWPASMAFARLGPDTPHLARAVKDSVTHPEGCGCPDCGRLRAAIGKGHFRDDSVAAVMAGNLLYRPGPDRKPCGCLPFVMCLCRPGKETAVSPGTGYLAAAGHIAGPDITCGCGNCARERREAAAGPVTRKTPGPPPATPLQELWAGIWAPLHLPEDQLPQYGTFGPHQCRECGGDPVMPGTNICWYCDTARGLRVAQAPPELRQAREAARHKRMAARNRTGTDAWLSTRNVLRMGLAGFACVVLASHVPGLGLLIIPGVLLIAAALVKGRRLP